MTAEPQIYVIVYYMLHEAAREPPVSQRLPQLSSRLARPGCTVEAVVRPEGENALETSLHAPMFMPARACASMPVPPGSTDDEMP